MPETTSWSLTCLAPPHSTTSVARRPARRDQSANPAVTHRSVARCDAMRTTTLALLSGAAMSISAASIFSLTPDGGIGSAPMHASLEPLAPDAWPALEVVSEPAATAKPTSDPAFVQAASASAPPEIPTATAIAQAPLPLPDASAFAPPPPQEATAIVIPAPPPKVVPANPPPKGAIGWRVRRNGSASIDSRPPNRVGTPFRVVVVERDPAPQQPSRPASIAGSPPVATSFAPASTSSARSMSTSARPASSAF